MGILERLGDFLRGGDPRPPMMPVELRDAAGALAIGGGRNLATWPTYDLAGQSAVGYRIAVAFACIDAIARATSAAKLRAYLDAGGQAEEDPEHPARALLTSPNPTMSEAEFWYFVVAMAASTGFCVIEKVRAAAGNVVELWPLVSPWLKVRTRSQKAPTWVYKVPNNPDWLLAAEDVIVVTYRPDPTGHPSGWSPLRALRRELAIDDDMTDFLNVLLQRGGVPPIGLAVQPQDGKIPKLDQAEADAIIERFVQKYGGSKQWNRPVWLGGLKVERIGLDLGELLWPEVREMVEAHVCLAFGVPAGMLGTQVGLARNTYSNAETDRRKFYEDTITPLWARLDGAFTRSLLPEFAPRPGTSLEFDVAEIPALQDDKDKAWTRATAAWGAGGVTLNQYQHELGLPGFGPAGDVIAVPFSVTLQQMTPEGQRRRPVGGDVRALPPGPALYPLPTERRAAVLSGAKATMAKLADQGAPKLRAFWKAQGERVVSAMTRSEARYLGDGALVATRASRDVAELDWQEEERLLAELLVRFYALNGETAFKGVADQLGIEIAFDLNNANVRRVLDRLATRIVGIHDTTREDVRRVVGQALDDGVGLNELADRLETMFTETYRNRALTVARTETQVAYNSASVLGYRESGVVASVELSDNPEHVDDYGASDGLTCAQRHGLIVPLDRVEEHIAAEHPNGSLAVIPVLAKPLGEE